MARTINAEVRAQKIKDLAEELLTILKTPNDAVDTKIITTKKIKLTDIDLESLSNDQIFKIQKKLSKILHNRYTQK